MTAAPVRTFGSRVAARTFALFALSAALPLLGGGWLAYTAVARELEQRAHARVADWAKDYGLEVFDRLIRADEMLLKASPDASPQYRQLAAATYSSIAFAAPGGDVPLLGEDAAAHGAVPAEAALAAAGRDATLVVDPATRTLVLVRRLPDGAVAYGRLRANYLWGDVDQLPSDTLFCVVTLDARTLFCPDPTLEGAAGATLVRGRDGDLLAAEWDLFLRSRFGVPDMRIIAAEPAESAFAALASFARIFPQTLALALVLALLAGLVQIRRSHRPLQALVDAMDGLSRGHFDRRIELRTQDEYARLATAVNGTAVALGRQFRALTVLSEIDRRILHAEAAEPVIESALPSVPELAGCDAGAVVLASEPGGRVVRLYGVGGEGPGVLERLELAAGELEGFEAQSGRWLALRGAAGTLAARLARDHATAAMLPLRADAQVLGALVLLSRAPREGTVDVAGSYAAELANRLSVALTNVRDKHQLLRQAYMDALTGLPNRELLRDRIGQELARSRRDAGRVALLFIDLDRFKNVNDSFGHSAGDALLRLAADRIRERVRNTDTVARLGGDEFTVLVPGVHGPAHARVVAEQVLTAFEHPFALEGGDYFASASIGIAISPEDGDGPEELLRNADTAMYRAKSSGRGAIAFFEDSMNRDARRRLELEQRLRTALDDGEIHVHFQPKVDLRTGRVVGAEALARWFSPSEGEVAPNVFVPIAEDTGLIVQLGTCVLAEACRHVADWRRRGHVDVHVAVNLSLRQLRQPDFPAVVGRLLAEHALPPAALELEVTESTLVEQPLEVTRILHELRALGVRIAIDDFGTGYSSLASLRLLPIDVLKIDRLFVRDVPGGVHAEAIAGAIIAMGHMLGKQIVAEGVENPAQAEFLRQRGCEMAQGYYFGHAQPGHEFAGGVHAPAAASLATRRA
jgi:diguanylate cyclase (GGDEF)-like protein